MLVYNGEQIWAQVEYCSMNTRQEYVKYEDCKQFQKQNAKLKALCEEILNTDRLITQNGEGTKKFKKELKQILEAESE